MSLGKELRLARIFGEDGKVVVVACDHGMHMMPLHGLVDMPQVLGALREADALLVSPGVARVAKNAFKGKKSPALIVRADTLTGIRAVNPPECDGACDVASPEDVLAMGADAMLVSHITGFSDSREEARNVERIARICQRCDRIGLPVIVEAAHYGRRTIGKPARADEILQLCRSAMEYGADIIKTIHTEGFHDLVRSVSIPVLVLGGDKTTPDKTLAMVRTAMEDGASGVVIGRNITQATHPARTLSEITHVVHK